ncbi:MAG: response regulator [Deltaproteobacteria bacterium]|nr:MAG: response regulator [Deltaproteobacteria bacterium]
MEPKYLTVLADCCQKIFTEMTRTEVVKVSVKRDERLKEMYAVAQVAPYEDFPKKVTGKFIMGFTDERLAVAVAAAIAEHLDLPLPRRFDDHAGELLNEFMNVVVGHTITGWDKMGLRISFSPPTSVRNVNIRDAAFGGQEAYMIVLDLGVERLVFTVTYTDANREQLRRRILVVDDSSIIRGILSKNLIEAGFTVEVAEDGEVAMDKHQTFRPHLTVMDLNMPNVGGLDAMQEICRRDRQAKFIVLTSTARRDEELIARSLNVLSYMVKPVQMQEFLTIVREALE